MNLIKRLFSWCQSRFKNPRLRMRKSSDLPEQLENNIIYLIGDESPWLMVLKCPCSCGEEIRLNLLVEESPNWKYKTRNKLIDVHPSIRRIKGCKSHFWIKSGKVIWCKKLLL